MDEILIGEKKYVSSKQAAKVTGYAKDYIGQLCREGRVPARLVGRSWYVLESAIHDHRFGNPKNEPVEESKPVQTLSPFQSTWEPPRYESAETEVLPSVNRLRDREASEPAENTDQEVAQRLQETWQTWFDRFDQVAGKTPISTIEQVQAIEVAKEPEDAEIKQSEAVHIPIHTVRHSPPEELPSHSHLKMKFPSGEGEIRKGSRGTVRVIQLSGALLAATIALFAVLGSGYFDSYILSSSQARMIAGVALYNK